MRRLFVDTAGWYMASDASDPGSEAARKVRDRHLERGGVLVTTDYVVDETLTLLRMKLGPGAARRWWSMVSESDRARIEPVTISRADRARDWFFGWEDKGFSFTDCCSFVVMRDLRIRKALTSDDHFVQAGFEILP